MKAKKWPLSGFTLVELLVVIGILAVLAVTLLIALNPAEAQKRTRDTKRLRDIATLQSAIEQFLNDGNEIPEAWENRKDFGTRLRSDTTEDQSCANNWLRVDLCAYLNNVPVDPLSGQNGSCPGTGECTLEYRFQFDTTYNQYELSVPIESESNVERSRDDGGDNLNYYEINSTGDPSAF